MILALLAPALPLALAASAPFPAPVTQAIPAPAFVAPGIARADYAVRTADGPLVVHVVAVDTHAQDVRLGVVLAHDRLVSPGETVSSMARRTGAVAGINADYFDIGVTNQPLNVVVRDGTLLRTPSRRAALWVDRAGNVAMGRMQFSGTVSWDGGSVPLTGVDIWPPQGGASLMEPAYGAPLQAPNVVALPLDVVDLASGAYRVAQTVTAPGPVLAFGPAALAAATPPPVGAALTIGTALTPQGDVAAAVGGGPLLVRDGAPVSDPDAPAPEETMRRFPLAGAAVRGDGTLLLVAVDGRRPESSIGLTRPQFAALLVGLGARDGMAFDSGGSSTLVARVLGDADATVRNDPSDGVERPVADGLFVYSDAPRGPADRLALRPAIVRALASARVPVEARLVDAAGHAFGAARVEGGGPPGSIVDGELTVDSRGRSGVVPVRAGAVRGELAVTVVDRLAALRIVPSNPNPDPGSVVTLRAEGEDQRGDAVATAGAVRWSARNAGIDAGSGRMSTGVHDAVVSAGAGGRVATLVIPVGRHSVPDAQAFAQRADWSFASAPAGAPGGVDVANRVVTLHYDLTGATRASYAQTQQPLPGAPVAIALDVQGDASGVALRASFVNRYGEPVALTLAKRVDWNGWRTLRIAIPGALNPPVTLKALYVVPTLGGPPVRARGDLAFRSLTLVEPGTP